MTARLAAVHPGGNATSVGSAEGPGRRRMDSILWTMGGRADAASGFLRLPGGLTAVLCNWRSAAKRAPLLEACFMDNEGALFIGAKLAIEAATWNPLCDAPAPRELPE